MNILAIAVHPDDETLGCGGTLLKYAARGHSLHWLIVTAASEPEYSLAQVTQQAQQIETVRRAYPFASCHWLKLPTTRLDALTLAEVIAAIQDVIRELRPEMVFVPNRSDVHSDHRVTFQATQAVLKSFYMRSLGVKRVLACEVLSETEAAPSFPENTFSPNVFVDVSATLDRKLEIMQLYAGELQSGFMPRTLPVIRAQALLRGASVGVEYAEAFMLVREID